MRAFLKWLRAGRPYITYTKAKCVICGRWIEETYRIPAYKSHGAKYDMRTVCDRPGCQEAYRESIAPWVP